MTKNLPQTRADTPVEVKAEASRLPVNKIIPVNAVLEVGDARIEGRRLEEIAELLWLPESIGETAINARIVRAVELFESLNPTDGAEGMLAVQMVGTHSAAMDCLRRASVDGQTPAARDMALKHAEKMMALYSKQLDTLNKHRGKGQQRVTVEHVTVAAGGQAIVGNIDTGSKTSNIPQAAIEHRVETRLEDVMPVAKVLIPRADK